MEAVFAVLRKLPEGSELLLVDDGSRDGTAEVLAPFASMEGVRVLTHRRNRGYGAALKTGIEAARNELIVITDADNTYPAKAIPKLAAWVSEGRCDMAVAKRPVGDQSMLRRPAKAVLRLLAEYLTGQKIPDMNSGLRAFRRGDALRRRRLLPDGFSFTTTITMATLTEGGTVDYLPIRYAKRVGSSKIRPVRDTANFALLMLRTIVAFHPLKVFGPSSLLFLAIGLGLLLVRLLLHVEIGIATTIVCVVTGAQLLAIGLLADLINRRS